MTAAPRMDTIIIVKKGTRIDTLKNSEDIKYIARESLANKTKHLMLIFLSQNPHCWKEDC